MFFFGCLILGQPVAIRKWLGITTKATPTYKYEEEILTQKFLTLAEVCDSLHISIGYLKGLIDKGKVKAIKSSKNYLISEFEHLKLIENMEVKQNDK